MLELISQTSQIKLLSCKSEQWSKKFF